MYERILLVGGPTTGKTHQVVTVANYLESLGKDIWVLDMEDKLGAMLESMPSAPKNIHLSVSINWEETKEALASWEKEVKPNSWVAVDRADLAWVAVQRWFTQLRYKIDMGEKMAAVSARMTKSAMFVPKFEQSDWLTINEQYESWIQGILYRLRCNVLLTAGVRGTREGEISPWEVFGHIGAAPRGQKELAHQPHSVFLLRLSKRGNDLTWTITTAKDLIGRDVFDDVPIVDFGIEYVGNYYRG